MSETTVSPLFPSPDPDSGNISLGRGVDVLVAVKDVAVVIQAGCEIQTHEDVVGAIIEEPDQQLLILVEHARVVLRYK